MTLARWEQLLAAWEANPKDLGFLKEHRAELQELVRGQEAQHEQDALNARKQQVTRELGYRQGAGPGARPVDADGVHSRFGRQSPKLIEFGLQPRKRKGGAGQWGSV